MIRLIAQLKCPKHPRYKGVRYPACGCWTCDDIFHTVTTIQRISQRYTIKYSDKVWPRISK